MADFSSAVLTADVALSICLSRCDDLVGDATLARVAREVWKDRPGLAAPLASSLTELVDELHRHRDRLRVLADQFTGMTDAEGLPVLSNAEFAAALARVASDHAPPADRPVAPEPGRR